MNITMNRAELLHAVRHAAAIAPINSPLEELMGVCLEVTAASKALVLTATNLEVTLKQKLTCDAQEDDALVIDARLLARMLEKLSGDTVELRRGTGASQLWVHGRDAEYRVSVWEQSSYPKAEIPAVSKLIRASGIPSMAKRTIFAADEKNEKPMLKCVHVRFTKDGLRAAGSDGNCVVTARGDDKSTGDFSVLIPANSLSRLAQMCEDKDEFRVGTTGKKVVFVREGFLFSARLIKANYIDTDFLTGSLKNQFTVLTDVAELRKGLDSVSCVDPDGKVKLSFEGMTLTFQCAGIHGNAQDSITVAPLTGMAQGEYWFLTRRMSNCLRSLSGTATLGVAAGGMLTLSTENAFYMQTGVRPGIDMLPLK
ncbi:hypothetical protein D1641_18125 [Colidextribacter sp. OB.20]|uniref:DNA polymerase III subunit beta family protein n=1 Tax=Colidextribacter sp. OB.20 TaxID=2304568 RepID=UPI00136EB6B9|nr:hypothetical protein [Colidextribacter sp. OB.20]NBI11885.1 hypothetical protein [Colidextribacter sp. OB.20]